MDSQPVKPNSNFILLALGLVVAIIILGVVMFKFQATNTTTSTSNLAGPTDDKTPIRLEQEIRFSDMGFEPKFVSIKAGTTVIWTNESTTEEISINSDDHPTHRKYPKLNLGEFEKDRSVELMFDTPGTYTYHNHFKPEQKGTIEVQP